MTAMLDTRLPRAAIPPALWAWLAWLVLLLIAFREAATSMVSIWWHFETYTHAFLVPPISAWLAWRRRETLARLPVQPQPWALVGLAAAGLLWLAGDLATVQAATHFALVSMIVFSVPAVFGMAVTRALLFPLLFLYFAVPFGEFLVPVLMDRTADFTVAALRFTGIPVYREGLSFVIPSGRWSVVEACSGIRYLIASFMVGALFAHLNYQSTRRRLIFVAVSLLVPIVANWLRAYMIVLIGHVSGNALAVGVDHLIYGWVFFGVVIGLMFWIGARWAEPDPPLPPPLASTGAAQVRSNWPVVAVALLLSLVPLAYRMHLQGAQTDAAVALSLPPDLPGGWVASSEPATWAPDFQAPRGVLERRVRRGDAQAGIWIGYYRQQGEGHKLVSSVNLVVAQKDDHWAQVSSGVQSSTIAGQSMNWRVSQLRHADPLVADRVPGLTVWQVYWIGGRLVTSDVKAKLWTAWDQFRGRGDDGAVIFLHAPSGAQGQATLEAFAADVLPAVLPMLEQAQAAK